VDIAGRGEEHRRREGRQERAAKGGGGKKESELLHPTCVFLHASPWQPFGVRYSNGLGEQRPGGARLSHACRGHLL